MPHKKTLTKSDKIAITFDKNENFKKDIISNRLNILSRIKDRKIVKLVRFREGLQQ
jgi:hypothetical protein